MKFCCLQENLNKGLSLVNRFIPGRPQLPILGNILFSCQKGELFLAATSLESGIKIKIGAKVEEEGEITVPAKTICELVNFLPQETIEFFLEENNLIIKSSKNQTKVAGISAAEFPPFVLPKEKEEIRLETEGLSSAVLETAFSAANDDARPTLSGIKIFQQGKKLCFVATDGYRLSFKKTELDAVEGLEKGMILPSRILSDVVKILSDFSQKEVLVHFSSSSGQVFFQAGEAMVFSRLIEGQYPDFEKIIPKSFTTRAVISKDELLKAVKTAGIFAREAANIIKLKVQSEKLKISANAPQVGENESEIEARIEGEEASIAFNVRFLTDFLNIINSEEIIFEMTTQTSPGVFKIKDDDSFLHLIMPVRVEQ